MDWKLKFENPAGNDASGSKTFLELCKLFGFIGNQEGGGRRSRFYKVFSENSMEYGTLKLKPSLSPYGPFLFPLPLLSSSPSTNVELVWPPPPLAHPLPHSQSVFVVNGHYIQAWLQIEYEAWIISEKCDVILNHPHYVFTFTTQEKCQNFPKWDKWAPIGNRHWCQYFILNAISSENKDLCRKMISVLRE